MMEQVPKQQDPQTPQVRPVRTIHISVQPKSWLGKLVAGIAGIALMLVAFLLSIVAFAVIAGIVMVAIVYVLWVTRRARRAMRDQVIDGEVKSRDIH
jgi:high-affinity Fe2+/Pb2+ permease